MTWEALSNKEIIMFYLYEHTLITKNKISRDNNLQDSAMS